MYAMQKVAIAGLFVLSRLLFMIWLIAYKPPPPPSHIRKLDRRHIGRLRKRDELLTGEGEEVGEEPNHTTARKPGPL
jgi:hypothetical protein